MAGDLNCACIFLGFCEPLSILSQDYPGLTVNNCSLIPSVWIDRHVDFYCMSFVGV